MSNKNVFAGTLEDKKHAQERILGLTLLMAAAFVVHVICAAAYSGFPQDMSCFSYWADSVFEQGFSKFYSLEAFVDYPPGYLYVLYVVGALRKLTGLMGVEGASAVLIKMPAMLCDLGIGYVIYKVACRYTKHNYAMLFSALYIFNPAIIINSATWGQVDAVFTLFVVLMIYFVTEKKLPIAYFILAIGILIKPQTLIFTPVLIYGIIDQVFLTEFTWKRMFKELAIGLSAIAVMFLLALPYGLADVISQYVDTLGSYEFVSVNAYNLWSLFGLNWHDQNDVFIVLSYKQWGTFFIVAIVAVSAWFCLRNKESESKYYLTGALIVSSMFMISVRMHERYMYPALALLLIAAAVKRQRGYYIAYGCLSLVHFLNAYHVLFYYDYQNYDFSNPVIYIISGMSVCAFAYWCYVLYTQRNVKRSLTYAEKEEYEIQKKINRGTVNKKKNNNANRNNRTSEKQNNANKEPVLYSGGWKIKPSELVARWNKWDTIIVVAITVIYALIAFYNLGDMKAPETLLKWEVQTEDGTEYSETGAIDNEIILDFGEKVFVSKMYTFLGYYENRKYEVNVSEDGVNWTRLSLGTESSEDPNIDPAWMNICSVFCWNDQGLYSDARYIKLVQKSDLSAIFEMMFYDNEGNVLTPVNTADYPELFDEQDIFDGTKDYMNGTYFDEIYHARTAYEMTRGMYCYENTHPPLGKAIIAIGILIFGMCPFGWRFMGTLIGVLMIPVMYLLGKKLTKQTWLATTFTLLFTFDFMHFAQTRIATIDVYVTFFIMLMYYFMLRYYEMSFNDTPLKKTFVPLALSGLFMGLGCASKWTGVYAGVGLAVIFGMVMLRRYMEYRVALKDPKGNTEGISHKYVIENYSIFTMKTLVFCVLAFVIVPGIIYLCAYIPFSDGTGNGLLSQMFANQSSMFNYHSTLVADHPYESTWFQWPVMTRPILYYNESVADGISSGISSMGNPFVWWVGIGAFLYMIHLAVKKRDRGSMFLIVGYLAQYLPWVLVSRCTFIYHYFPSVPFVVMMIGYGIYRLLEDKPKKLRIVVVVYVVIVIAAFAAFYPVLSGLPTPVSYVQNWLQWLEGWVLLY